MQAPTAKGGSGAYGPPHAAEPGGRSRTSREGTGSGAAVGPLAGGTLSLISKIFNRDETTSTDVWWNPRWFSFI